MALLVTRPRFQLRVCCRQGSKRKSLSAQRQQQKPLSEKLGGSSVILIGQNTQLQNEVALKFASQLQYSPLIIQNVLQKYISNTNEISDEKCSDEEVLEIEKQILESVSTQLRCCIAATGSDAVLDESCWKFLYGHVIVQLGKLKDGKYFEKAEAVIDMDQISSEGEEKISKIIGLIEDALNVKLQDNRDLPKNKQLYIKLGCRGDWPDISLDNVQFKNK